MLVLSLFLWGSFLFSLVFPLLQFDFSVVLDLIFKLFKFNLLFSVWHDKNTCISRSSSSTCPPALESLSLRLTQIQPQTSTQWNTWLSLRLIQTQPQIQTHSPSDSVSYICTWSTTSNIWSTLCTAQRTVDLEYCRSGVCPLEVSPTQLKTLSILCPHQCLCVQH